MFVALHEMRRLVGRFVLLTGAIALLVVLLLFFQTIAGALTSGLTGGIENNQADVFVYSDKARKNPSASFLAPSAVDAVAAVDGVAQAGGVAKGQFTASGSNSDVAVIGLEDPTIGGPATIADGRMPTTTGEALASNPSLSAGDLKFAIGDTVKLEGVSLTVVGTAEGAAFDVSPTLYVTLDDLQTMNSTKAGTTLPPLLNWVAVIVDDGADPNTVAARITDDVDYSAAGPPDGVTGAPPDAAAIPGAATSGTGPTTPGTTTVTSSAPGATTPATTPDGTTPDGTTVAGTAPPGTGVPETAPAGSTPATTTTTATDGSTVQTSVAGDSNAEGSIPAGSIPAGSVPAGSIPAGSIPADAGGAGRPNGGPPAGIPDGATMPSLGGKVQALDRNAAAQALPGVDQISQSFNILYLLLFIVVTIVTGVFFLILTVQKQDSLVLMRALGATSGDVVRPVLIEVVVVVGLGSLIGVAVAGGMLYALRATFGSTLNPVTTIVSVVFILILGVLATFGSVRRVLAIDPVQAARTAGE